MQGTQTSINLKFHKFWRHEWTLRNAEIRLVTLGSNYSSVLAELTDISIGQPMTYIRQTNWFNVK